MVTVSSAGSPSRRRRSHVPWMVAVIAVLTALVLVPTWMLLSYLGFFSRSDPSEQLRTTFSGLEAEISPVEATDELCAEIECVEGWRTDLGRYLRFETNDAAELWSIAIGGDAYRSGTIVLDRNGFELTNAERRWSVELLFAGRDWHTAPGEW